MMLLERFWGDLVYAARRGVMCGAVLGNGGAWCGEPGAGIGFGLLLWVECRRKFGAGLGRALGWSVVFLQRSFEVQRQHGTAGVASRVLSRARRLVPARLGPREYEIRLLSDTAGSASYVQWFCFRALNMQARPGTARAPRRGRGAQRRRGSIAVRRRSCVGGHVNYVDASWLIFAKLEGPVLP